MIKKEVHVPCQEDVGIPSPLGWGCECSLERRDVLRGYCRRVGREMRGMCNGEDGWMVERGTEMCVEDV